MTSEVSTVGHPHTLIHVNGSFVNDTNDRTEPSLPSDLVLQRRFQLEGPSLCQLDQFPCELLGTDRKLSECCMASCSATKDECPWPWAQELPEMELALQGWMRDVWQWLLTTQGLSCWCTCIPSLLQSLELMCVPVPLPLTLCAEHSVEWSTSAR